MGGNYIREIEYEITYIYTKFIPHTQLTLLNHIHNRKLIVLNVRANGGFFFYYYYNFSFMFL